MEYPEPDVLEEDMTFDEELLEKRQQLIDSGTNPYPYSYDRSHDLATVREKQEALLDQEVRLAGRVVAYRGRHQPKSQPKSQFVASLTEPLETQLISGR